jgi:DNA adenine methylase
MVNYDMSFASKGGKSGWVVSINTKCDNSALGWRHKIDELIQSPIVERLRGVFLDNRDAFRVIEYTDSPETCFVLDPPYPGTEQKGYKHTFSQDDLIRLVDVLGQIKASFVLSGYPNDAIPKEWPCWEIETVCSIGTGPIGGGRWSKVTTKHAEGLLPKRTECLWVVDRSPNGGLNPRLFEFALAGGMES